MCVRSCTYVNIVISQCRNTHYTFLTFETAVCKTISPEGPVRSCSGALLLVKNVSFQRLYFFRFLLIIVMSYQRKGNNKAETVLRTVAGSFLWCGSKELWVVLIVFLVDDVILFTPDTCKNDFVSR